MRNVERRATLIIDGMKESQNAKNVNNASTIPFVSDHGKNIQKCMAGMNLFPCIHKNYWWTFWRICVTLSIIVCIGYSPNITVIRNARNIYPEYENDFNIFIVDTAWNPGVSCFLWYWLTIWYIFWMTWTVSRSIGFSILSIYLPGSGAKSQVVCRCPRDAWFQKSFMSNSFSTTSHAFSRWIGIKCCSLSWKTTR